MPQRPPIRFFLLASLATVLFFGGCIRRIDSPASRPSPSAAVPSTPQPANPTGTSAAPPAPSAPASPVTPEDAFPGANTKSGKAPGHPPPASASIDTVPNGAEPGGPGGGAK